MSRKISELLPEVDFYKKYETDIMYIGFGTRMGFFIDLS